MSCVGDINKPNYELKAEAKRDEAHVIYPYEAKDEDGKFTFLVLGPDTYASGDGSLVVWRGVPYARVEKVNLPDPVEQANGSD
jgi:hypothetical protein